MRKAAHDLVGRHSIADPEQTLGQIVTAALDPPADGIVHARDLARSPDADRWPNYAPQAVGQGYRSMLSTQLSTNGGTRAALNLYSRRLDAFGDAPRTIAGLFAVQAALLLYGTDHAVHMQQALGTRDVIGQAKGILMERFDVDGEHAFEMLVRSPQDTNLKLVEIAQWLAGPEGRPKASSPPPGR